MLMVYQGTVHNGVVVFEIGVQLPEGPRCDVELVKEKPAEERLSPEEDALFRMGELAIDTGISDLGVNIDHYLYGHPKVDGTANSQIIARIVERRR